MSNIEMIYISVSLSVISSITLTLLLLYFHVDKTKKMMANFFDDTEKYVGEIRNLAFDTVESVKKIFKK